MSSVPTRFDLKKIIVQYYHTNRCPANTRRWINGVLTLGQRRRRWPNVKTPLIQRPVFAERECIDLLVQISDTANILNTYDIC